MGNVALTTNIDEVFAKMDAYVDSVSSVAAPRALNKLAAQAQTAGLKTIADVYGIGPRTFEKYVSTRLATSQSLRAVLTATGSKGFPLSLFNPVQSAKGVTVTIKGHAIFIPHAFMVPRFGKHVFARGSYGGKASKFVATGESFGRFLFGRKRLSISELYTFTPPEAFGNKEVQLSMRLRLAEQAGKVFAQEVSFASR